MKPTDFEMINMRNTLAVVALFLMACSTADSEGVAEPTPESSLWSVDESFIKEGAPFAFIDAPEFATVGTVDKVADEERVLLVKHNETLKAYPYVYLNYSEVVNDAIDGFNYIVSYCPQTKSGICFTNRINGAPQPVLASGYLFKDNLVLTDRENKSYWSQMLLKGIRGGQKELPIQTTYSIETTWKTVKNYFPEAKVYIHDKLQTKGARTASNGSNHFGVVLEGLEERIELYRHQSFDKLRIRETTVGGKNVVVLGDREKQLFTAFYVQPGAVFTLRSDFPNVMLDTDGTVYNVFGEAVEGPKKGQQLASPRCYNAELWAWQWFFEQTAIAF